MRFSLLLRMPAEKSKMRCEAALARDYYAANIRSLAPSDMEEPFCSQCKFHSPSNSRCCQKLYAKFPAQPKPVATPAQPALAVCTLVSQSKWRGSMCKSSPVHLHLVHLRCKCRSVLRDRRCQSDKTPGTGVRMAYDLLRFNMRPSVGTWLMQAPKGKASRHYHVWKQVRIEAVVIPKVHSIRLLSKKYLDILGQGVWYC